MEVLMGKSCKKGISSMSSIAMFDYCRLLVPVDFSTSSMRCLRGLQTRTPTFGQELELGQVEPKISVLDYLKRIDKYFACSFLASNTSWDKDPFTFSLRFSREGMDGNSETLLQVMQLLTRLPIEFGGFTSTIVVWQHDDISPMVRPNEVNPCMLLRLCIWIVWPKAQGVGVASLLVLEIDHAEKPWLFDFQLHKRKFRPLFGWTSLRSARMQSI
jgi:hypothetical protein